MKKVLFIIAAMLMVSCCAEKQYQIYVEGDVSDLDHLSTQYGVEDKSGNIIIRAIYDDVYIADDDSCFAVSTDDRWGVLDPDMNWIIPMSDKYSAIIPGDSGIFAVEMRSDGKWRYMLADGTMITETGFDYAEPFIGEFGVFSIDRRHGVIYRNGTVIIPAEYDGITISKADMTAEVITTDYSTEYFRLTPQKAEPITEILQTFDLSEYKPFTGAKVARIDEEPTLEKRADPAYRHPLIDCATALYPVASAVVTEVYPEKNGADMLQCNKTAQAYTNLINGDVDLIFCAEPSQAEIDEAAMQNIDFNLTEFGKEAFVFIVSKDTPIDNITSDQLRDIYSGKITKWDQLGVEGLGNIIAYQRPENSGSQTALEAFMGDTPIMEAPSLTEEDMMGIVTTVVSYKTLPNAIGYSFRFYCTDMLESPVKLLSIDNVAPTVENIRSGAYPLISELYCVTRKGEENPNVQALVDWIISDQGQRLIAKTGYVPVS